ncbi:hypothetical protein PIB30_014654, partial [Stylosanthes scabra]|nr:hypothetical protein [Stylosanthes scabra]
RRELSHSHSRETLGSATDAVVVFLTAVPSSSGRDPCLQPFQAFAQAASSSHRGTWVEISSYVASLGLLSSPGRCPSPASHRRSWSLSSVTHPHTLFQGRFALMLRLREKQKGEIVGSEELLNLVFSFKELWVADWSERKANES